MNYKKVHISQIKPGDTVIHNGQLKTVTSSVINRSEFMGRTLWGDSYNLGYKKVKKI